MLCPALIISCYFSVKSPASAEFLRLITLIESPVYGELYWQPRRGGRPALLLLPMAFISPPQNQPRVIGCQIRRRDEPMDVFARSQPAQHRRAAVFVNLPQLRAYSCKDAKRICRLLGRSLPPPFASACVAERRLHLHSISSLDALV